MPRRKKRVGNQKPTFERIGKYHHSDAKACINMFSHYGFKLDDAQKYELELYMAKDAKGMPAAETIGAAKPRQNGKSFAARLYGIWCAAICGMDVVYSAHNADTVDEFFDMIVNLFTDDETYPDLAELLLKAYRQPGKQYLLFDCGHYKSGKRAIGRLKFSTRTTSKARGGTRSLIIIDEAQELTDAQLNAILPTVSASKDGSPQVIYIGTPPDPTCRGTVFKRMHDTAHSDSPGEAWWLEWAAKSVPREGTSDEEALKLAYETNPALGSRITERAVLNEWHQMTKDGFARERLGWWSTLDTSVEYIVNANDWNECITEEPYDDGLLAFGIKYSLDGKKVAISAALTQQDNPTAYVELVDIADAYGAGQNLAQWIKERESRIACVVIDGRSGATQLAERLQELRFPKRGIVLCDTKQAVAAASRFVDEVGAHSICHVPSPALDESVTGSSRRAIGNNGGFGFGDSPKATCTAAESAALALYGVRTTKRNPARKQVVW